MIFLVPRCEPAVLAALPDKTTVHEELGCGLQGPASRLVRRALLPLRKRIQRLGEARALEQSDALLAWLEESPAWSELCTAKRVAGRRQLKAYVLYPEDKLEPRVLQLRHATDGHDYAAIDTPLDAAAFPAMHDLIALLQGGAALPELRRVARQGGLEHRLDAWLEAGLAAEGEDDRAPDEVREAGLWFVGHNTVLVSSGQTRVIIDPWFRPWRDADPADYRAVRPRDVGPVDAVLITHSHGDHFHLGSLLSFHSDTLMLVPKVARESVLSTAMAHRLRQVGFTRVRELDWWESTKVGDLRIEAMPFFGEQGSSLALVDPSLRNQGNAWCVRTPQFSAAFLADTGTDPAGSMAQVALEARRRHGPVDFVFSGMRGFATAPLLLPFTTIDALFVNVPPEVMPVRQRLMHDADDVLTVAELFGARWAVPYADGGAPWYWREGMGPAYRDYPSYPGEIEAPGEDREQPGSAPFPERLIEAAQRRYGDRPRVEPLVLRPGDLVRVDARRPRTGRLRVGAVEGFAWPWGDREPA